MGFDQLASDHLQEGVYVTDKVLFAVSMVLCLAVLALAGWIYRVKQARQHLRRVSFRLMLWAMGFQVGYNVFRELLLADTAISETVSDAPVACSTLATLFFQTLTTTNCLITCIAVNLALITCLGINPIELGLERWYIAGSLLFGLGLPIIPAALGHFGPDPIYGNCYLSVADKDLRLRVVLGEMVIWQFLSCIVASAAVCAAIIQLVRQSRVTKKVMRTSMQISDPPEVEASPVKACDKRSDLLALPSLSPIIGSPNPLLADDNLYEAAPAETDYPGKSRWRIFSRVSSRDEYGQLHDKVFGIALRISLYPIALIIINIVQSVGDVYFAYTIGDRETTRGEVVLYVFYRATYAGRGIILALLCLLCDPCLKRGVSTAWRETFGPKNQPVEHDLPPVNIQHEDDGDKNQTPLSLADFMNVSVLNKAYAVPETRRASTQSLDISAALQRLPFYPSNLHPLDSVRNIRSARAGTREERDARSASSISADRMSTGSYTRSFAGVATASLPSEMTDDVDVDLRLSYSPSRSRFSPHPSASDTGDIADELEPVVASAVYEETEEGIVLQPVHATPRPSLVSVPGSRQVERELISKLDKLAQVEETAGPSRPQADPAMLSRSGSKKPNAKEEPRKISWGSIPTAPMPSRMLARQKRQAAAAAAAERRSREEEEDEKRRLAELEVQL